MSQNGQMKTVAVYSLKGGVGKTTFAVNLAWASATLSQRRTLLWDLDPQAASSWLLNPAKKAKDEAQAVFARDVKPLDLCRKTDIPRLDLLAADTSLRGLDQMLHEIGKRKRLAKLTEDLARQYDRLVLDCPPGLTETSEQVLNAADIVVVPVIPSPLAQKALADLGTHLTRRGGKHPAILPVYSMVDRRRAVHQAALADKPDWPVVSYASLIEKMSVRQRPLGAFAPKSPAAAQFGALWASIEQKLSAS